MVSRARCFTQFRLLGRKIEEDQTYERSCLHGSWQNRQTQKVSRWQRSRWWYASRENHDEQIVSFQKECLIFLFSHPGYYGKTGMRVFHLQRNWKHCPTVNTDKLWSLVSEQTRKAAEKSKDKAPVIDVTKSVSIRAFLLVFQSSILFILY